MTWPELGLFYRRVSVLISNYARQAARQSPAFARDVAHSYRWRLPGAGLKILRGQPRAGSRLRRFGHRAERSGASFSATLRRHKRLIIRTDARRFRGNQFGYLVQGKDSGCDASVTARCRAVRRTRAALFSMPEGLKGTLFFPSVANLKSARTLALDDDFAVLRAQFELANVTDRRRVSTL